MADNFKCPKCGSGRSKPLSLSISDKSDLVSSLPQRPSNGAAYLWILLGGFGLLFALLIGFAYKGVEVFAAIVGGVSILLLLGGVAARKSEDQLANAHVASDRRWLCARCGHQWQQ
jgi:hypothetical protein